MGQINPDIWEHIMPPATKEAALSETGVCTSICLSVRPSVRLSHAHSSKRCILELEH